MNVKEMVDLLREVPLFANVEPAQLQLLIFSAQKCELDPGQILTRRGESGNCAYLILRGEAEAIADETEDVLADVAAGAFVGELSMIAKLPYSVTIRAKSDIIAAKVTHELFVRVCAEFPDTAVQMLRVLSGKLDRSVVDLQDVQRMFDETGPFVGS